MISVFPWLLMRLPHTYWPFYFSFCKLLFIFFAHFYIKMMLLRLFYYDFKKLFIHKRMIIITNIYMVLIRFNRLKNVFYLLAHFMDTNSILVIYDKICFIWLLPYNVQNIFILVYLNSLAYLFFNISRSFLLLQRY